MIVGLKCVVVPVRRLQPGKRTAANPGSDSRRLTSITLCSLRRPGHERFLICAARLFPRWRGRMSSCRRKCCPCPVHGPERMSIPGLSPERRSWHSCTVTWYCNSDQWSPNTVPAAPSLPHIQGSKIIRLTRFLSFPFAEARPYSALDCFRATTPL